VPQCSLLSLLARSIKSPSGPVRRRLAPSRPVSNLPSEQAPACFERDAQGRCQTRSEAECWVNVGWEGTHSDLAHSSLKTASYDDD
jgi:hypothetical protein